jgi:hypothetical protein
VVRARYDELLAVAERWTVESIRNPGRDATSIAAGWQAIYRAAEHHFGWLGQTLPAGPRPLEATPDPLLANVANAIGAAADLLAMHGEVTADLREDPTTVADARRSLAVLVLNAAYAARTAFEANFGRGTPRMAMVRLRHLEEVCGDLAQLMRNGSGVGCLPPGTLNRLSTAFPAPRQSLPGAIASSAARWSHLHQEHGHIGVVTRDLRATTAQQRTTNAMTAHVVGGLIDTGSDYGLCSTRVALLTHLQSSLYQADRGLLTVEQQWRRFASAAPGPSQHPAVDAHETLARLLRALVRPQPDTSLARGRELIPDAVFARGVLAAVDELTQALADVADQQATVVKHLVNDHDLLISRDAHGRRAGRRLAWVRLYRLSDANPLIAALAAVESMAATAARTARDAAGTVDQIRARPGRTTVTVRPLDRLAPEPPVRTW